MKLDNLPQATTASRIVAIVLTLPFLYVGITELISSNGADATFGIPLGQAVSVVGARNIILSLLGIFFAIIGQRTSMAAIYFGLALMAAMDCFIVSSAVGITNAAIKHATFVVLLICMATWIIFAGRSKK